MMKYKYLFLRALIAIVSIVPMSAQTPKHKSAQTYKQKGVVRLITNSASSQIKPVKGLKVAVGNVISSSSDASGQFSVSVPSRFRISGISSDEYILTLPTKDEEYLASANKIDVVVTTKSNRDSEYKRISRQLKATYDRQTDSLLALKRAYHRAVEDLEASDARYEAMKAKADSLDALYQNVISNEDKILNQISSMAQTLAITDYQSLDSIERRTYELKCAGEWKSLVDFLLDVMNGDAQAYVQQAIANKSQAESQLQQAESQLAAARRDLSARLAHVEDAIDAYRMLHLNDSVAHLYQILIAADPTNWEYLTCASNFAGIYEGNRDKALELTKRAIEVAPNDSIRSISLINLSANISKFGNLEEAINTVNEAIEIRRNIGNKTLIAKSLTNLASLYWECDSLNLAQINVDEAIRLLEEAESENEEFWLPYLVKSRICAKNGNFSEAYDWCLKSVESLDDEENNLLELTQSYSCAAAYMYEMGEYDYALKLYERALEIDQDLFNPSHPEIAIIYGNIANLYYHLSRYDDAIEYTLKASEILKDNYGEINRDIATGYSNLGNYYIDKEEYQKAYEYFMQAIDILSELFDESHSLLTQPYMGLGYLFYTLNQFDYSEKYYTKTYEIYRDLYGPDNINTLKALFNISRCYIGRRQYNTGVEYLEKILNACGPITNDNFVLATSTLLSLGNAYRELYQPDKAIESLFKALNLYDSKGIISEQANCYLSIGRAYLLKEDPQTALSYFQKAEELFTQSGESSRRTAMVLLADIALTQAQIHQWNEAISNFHKVIEYYSETFGEDSPMTQNYQNGLRNILLAKAKSEGEESLKEFLCNHCFVAEVVEGYAASESGLSGEYIWMEYNDWAIPEISDLSEFAKSNYGKPVDAVFYRDGEFLVRHFEGVQGTISKIRDIAPEEKAWLIEEYRRWKAQQAVGE